MQVNQCWDGRSCSISTKVLRSLAKMQNKVSTDFWNNFEGLGLYKYANFCSTLICLGWVGFEAPSFDGALSVTGPFGWARAPFWSLEWGMGNLLSWFMTDEWKDWMAVLSSVWALDDLIGVFLVFCVPLFYPQWHCSFVLLIGNSLWGYGRKDGVQWRIIRRLHPRFTEKFYEWFPQWVSWMPGWCWGTWMPLLKKIRCLALTIRLRLNDAQRQLAQACLMTVNCARLTSIKSNA